MLKVNEHYETSFNAALGEKDKWSAGTVVCCETTRSGKFSRLGLVAKAQRLLWYQNKGLIRKDAYRDVSGRQCRERIVERLTEIM